MARFGLPAGDYPTKPEMSEVGAMSRLDIEEYFRDLFCKLDLDWNGYLKFIRVRDYIISELSM
jgi:hypothetical protein